MRSLSFLASLAALAVLVSAAPGPADRYAGTRVVRVPGGNSTQVASIDQLISRLGLDTWTSVTAPNHPVDIVVPPARISQFSEEISQLGLPVTVMHADLGASILKESQASASKDFSVSALVNSAWFNAYHSYADHTSFINELATTYPKNSKIFTIGTSQQGRQITGINIFGSSGSGTKPGVIFFGTIHAREWITTMVTEYLAYNLLSDSAAQKYLDKYDFYIIPIVNPDGFVYTQTSDRMWRKSRSPAPSGSTCIGTDLNRNFPYKWEAPGGASTSPCSETYKGRSAGDTPETAAMARFLESRGLSSIGARLFIDFHSYGNYFLSPYGWTSSVPPNNAQIQSVAKGFAAAVKAVHGISTTTGPSGPTLYATTGTTVDHAFEVAKIPYSYTNELRDTGTYGFVLPANQILPTGQDAYAGVKYLLDTI
ncbi:hypothetical protein BDZ94DRAFT_586488 [Collybia nuda]|uniref:Carboxypeptidase M14A n=1 Tax=Collybia nuda TaxID=64659 RepID=A0A9P5Y7U0_9AGAR|nr:hypothetical protein BDZ94DRAFT_586488 [Collybia nuda]